MAEVAYACVSGPTYETPGEARFLRHVGADVVGMSTVPVVVTAREEGLEVMVLSLVTNFVGIPDTYRSACDEVAAKASPAIYQMRLLRIFIYFSLWGRSLSYHQHRRYVSHETVLAIGKEKAGVLMKLVESVINSL